MGSEVGSGGRGGLALLAVSSLYRKTTNSLKTIKVQHRSR